MPDETLPHARLFVRLGFALLPLQWPVRRDGRIFCSCGKADCTSIGKHPVARLAPGGLKNASRDPATIDRWFTDRNYNIGIATGSVSGFIALDIDPRHEGDSALAQLEAQHGPLPATWRFLTGGGGEHILFRHPGKAIANSAGRIAAGIDVRGDGGYIVAPPSMHASGRPYAISVDHDPEQVPLADIPTWLMPFLLPVQRPAGNATAAPQDWRGVTRGIVPEGKRNDTVARLAGHLLRRRVDPWVVAELLAAWGQVHCVPPMASDEILSTVRSIAQKEIARRGERHA